MFSYDTSSLRQVQPDFCRRAAALLSRAGWRRRDEPADPHEAGDRGDGGDERGGGGGAAARDDDDGRAAAPSFAVVEANVRAYLRAAPDRSFDVVLAAGLLHCFSDPVGE